KSGMKGFLTQKLGSNEQTRFPYSFFWWQGVDGSKILTVFPPGGYANPVQRAELLGQLSMLKGRHDVNEELVVFGVGNHGGGVTRGHLDRAFAIKNGKGEPNLVFTSADRYFDHLHELAATHSFPTWDDELYLEHHRGTYTSQSETKKNNRRIEQLLMDAEKLSSIAHAQFGAAYPAASLFNPGWSNVMLNHFHDILPGSGITKVYSDAAADYAKSRAAAENAIAASLKKIAGNVDTRGGGEPLLVFNTLSWKRDAIVEAPFEGLSPKVQVFAPDDKPVPCQLVKKNGKTSLLFVARGLPPMGYAVYHVYPKGGSPSALLPKSTVSKSGNVIENQFIRIELDPSTGALKSVYDKKLNREFLTAGKSGALLQAFKDTQNAWEIMSNDPIPFGAPGAVEVVENGPVRITLKTTRPLQNSTFSSSFSIVDGIPLAFGNVETDVKDHNVTVKLAFDLALLNEDAWFEIPYAAISRKAIPKTQAESAKFEVSAQNWVDYTDTGGAAGFSLLNTSKYGYDVKQNVLRMTLLRTPTYPDPEADQGRHSIDYSIYTHPGDWREADTSRQGYAFNYTPYVFRAGKHPGKLPAVNSFFAAGPDDVALTVVKKSEDGDRLVLRFVETEGRATMASIKLPWKPASVTETNLIEDRIEPASLYNVSGDTLSVPLGKFEIKTLIVSK
ncbi:MAG TPA: glycoside hydrolase family 38 C-terminal domain-containing protein, partial [bacterium]|nr:glycoside hydrolase family 38 C-terminal domain-containing protein [bacterium]